MGARGLRRRCGSRGRQVVGHQYRASGLVQGSIWCGRRVGANDRNVSERGRMGSRRGRRLRSRCRCRQVEHQQPQQVVREPRASAVSPQNLVRHELVRQLYRWRRREAKWPLRRTYVRADRARPRQRSSTRTRVADPPERARRGAAMSAGTAAAYTRGDGRLYLQDVCRTAAWVTAR